jgi:lysozyme family protein
MADFNLAIPILLQEEGGAKFTNDLSDAGGATKYGVTLAELVAHGCDFDGDGDTDAEDVKAMTEEQANEIYLADYWNKYRLGEIESQSVAMKAFSLIVNAGGNGAKIIQRGAMALGADITDDGGFGDHTIAALNGVDATQLMDAIVEAQKTYYWSITAKNISTKALTKLGWTEEQQQAGLEACKSRDLNQVSAVLTSIHAPAVQGNLKFIKGWLNRAANRYGI